MEDNKNTIIRGIIVTFERSQQQNQLHFIMGIDKNQQCGFFFQKFKNNGYPKSKLRYLASKVGEDLSKQIIGNSDFIFDSLKDKNSHENIHEGCFLIHLGKIDEKQIDYMYKLFKSRKQKLIQGYTDYYQDLLFVPCELILQQVYEGQSNNAKINLQNNVYECFSEYSLKFKYSLQKLQDDQPPFQNNNDSFQQWIQNQWKPQIEKYHFLRKPQKGDIDYNNNNKGKNYAAGVIPCCQDSQGQAYFLLGLESSGWSYFQGWQDKGDYNEEFTAAREGAEETNDVIGNLDFLLETLNNKDNFELLFQGCFLICLGELSQKEMQYIPDVFQQKRASTINPCKREHKKLKWVKAQTFFEAVNDQNGFIKDMENEQKQHLRKFVYQCFPKNWKQYASLSNLLQNKNPFPNNSIKFKDWLYGNWGSDYE